MVNTAYNRACREALSAKKQKANVKWFKDPKKFPNYLSSVTPGTKKNIVSVESASCKLDIPTRHNAFSALLKKAPLSESRTLSRWCEMRSKNFEAALGKNISYRDFASYLDLAFRFRGTAIIFAEKAGNEKRATALAMRTFRLRAKTGL